MHSSAMSSEETKTDTSKALHETLRQIPYTIFAIGVGEAGGDDNGYIGSWVTQCSFDPPLLAISVSRDTASYKLIEKHGVFSINLLGKDQEDIARALVKPSHRDAGKMDKISYKSGTTSAPVLTNCLSYIECKVVSKIDTGEHALIIGEAVNAEQFSADVPLTCADLGWHYAG